MTPVNDGLGKLLDEGLVSRRVEGGLKFSEVFIIELAEHDLALASRIPFIGFLHLRRRFNLITCVRCFCKITIGCSRREGRILFILYWKILYI